MDSGLPHDVRISFPAKYDSNCPGCSAAIYMGDSVGFVDDVCVCPDCREAALRENREALRALALAQRERDRAEDPEQFARIEAAAKRFTDAVKAKAPLDEVLDAADAADMAEDPEGTVQAGEAAKYWLERVRANAAREPGKEWVTSPAGSGWVRNPHHEPQDEQEAPVAVEPGIQALMAAGLLEGQQPGGSGVCVAEIHAAGTVTEVQIPVPVNPQGPSVDSTEAPGDRVDQLAAAAAEWSPAQAQADALQASLQSAVDARTMTPDVAASLGWMPPAVQQEIRETQEQDAALGREIDQHYAAEAPVGTVMEVAGMRFTKHSEPESPWNAASPSVVQSGGSPWEPVGRAIKEGLAVAVTHEGPRITEAREQARMDLEHAPADLFLSALAAATSAAEEQAILDTLDALPAYVGRDSMDAEKRDLLGVIVGAINNHPRSLQVKIGPSEIGTECDHCLAAKLAGWTETERGEAWLPTIGTAVHSWIEQAFRNHPEGPNGTRRFLTETRVPVGEIDGEEITGSTDLADVVAGWTWDWKIVGPTTLKSAKVKPSRQYVVQQMLYARGWNRLGVKITHVGIAYLPRNAMSLNAGVWWSAPYDPAVAEAALERATNMARNLKAMEAVGGAAMRDSYISGLDRWRQFQAVGPGGVTVNMTGNAQEGRIICMDCPRYPDYPLDAEPVRGDQLEGLI